MVISVHLRTVNSEENRLIAEVCSSWKTCNTRNGQERAAFQKIWQYSLAIWELGWEQVEVGKRSMNGDGKDFALGDDI